MVDGSEGEVRRSARYRRAVDRFEVALLVVPAVVGLVAVVVAVGVGRLPSSVAIHWASGRPDGFASVPGLVVRLGVVYVLGAVVPFLLSRSVASRSRAVSLVGASAAVSGVVACAAVLLVVRNWGVASGFEARDVGGWDFVAVFACLIGFLVVGHIAESRGWHRSNGLPAV